MRHPHRVRNHVKKGRFRSLAFSLSLNLAHSFSVALSQNDLFTEIVFIKYEFKRNHSSPPHWQYTLIKYWSDKRIIAAWHDAIVMKLLHSINSRILVCVLALHTFLRVILWFVSMQIEPFSYFVSLKWERMVENGEPGWFLVYFLLFLISATNIISAKRIFIINKQSCWMFHLWCYLPFWLRLFVNTSYTHFTT